MHWHFFPHKAKMREFVLPAKKIRSGIWLPADQALCVKKAHERGFITPATNVYLVEKDHSLYQKMVRSTLDIPNRVLFNGDLTQLRPAYGLDYAFFDLLGGITAKLAGWMSAIFANRLLVGSTVAITHMIGRKTPLLPAQDKLLRTHFGKHLRKSYGTTNLRFQRVLLLLHRIFHKWDFDIETPDGEIPTYKDLTISMMVLKLVNFRITKSILYPSLEEDYACVRSDKCHC